jgi:hypothetical protein
MDNENLEEKFQKLRIQARVKVYVLVSSLILFFLWFANFSWGTEQKTFSAMAMAAAVGFFGVSEQLVVPVTLIITLIYTVFYIILIKALLSSLKG